MRLTARIDKIANLVATLEADEPHAAELIDDLRLAVARLRGEAREMDGAIIAVTDDNRLLRVERIVDGGSGFPMIVATNGDIVSVRRVDTIECVWCGHKTAPSGLRFRRADGEVSGFLCDGCADEAHDYMDASHA